mmetsp:Transcript_20797/g.55685  ORF Transcript_20797/g.55685 Transcript_20797/m.55685 type:complete len:228 (-) Transcript_20797:58-741(-)
MAMLPHAGQHELRWHPSRLASRHVRRGIFLVRRDIILGAHRREQRGRSPAHLRHRVGLRARVAEARLPRVPHWRLYVGRGIDQHVKVWSQRPVERSSPPGSEVATSREAQNANRAVPPLAWAEPLADQPHRLPAVLLLGGPEVALATEPIAQHEGDQAELGQPQGHSQGEPKAAAVVVAARQDEHGGPLHARGLPTGHHLGVGVALDEHGWVFARVRTGSQRPHHWP